MWLLIIGALCTLFLGSALGYYIRYRHALLKRSSVEFEIKEKLLDAESKAIKVIEEAENKAYKLEEETKHNLTEKEESLRRKEERLDTKEENLEQKQIDLESQKENVREKIEEIKNIKKALDERALDIDRRLEEIAGLEKHEAYERLLEKTKQDESENILERIQRIKQRGEEEFKEVAQNILLTAIYRVGNSMPSNILTSNVEIGNEEIKGKIIGKEGRNVRAFERATGVDVLVDETPGYIVLSSFDPVRREMAKTALESLIKDGRIQPAKIEEEVETAKQHILQTIKEMGEKAAFEAGVTGLHPDLLSVLGRLHFRTSYGQNVLNHSVEVAQLCGLLAEEIGIDPTVAKAGGLLHDIGKALDHEVSGSHVDIGMRLLKKYGVGEEVILAMRSHHEEYPYKTAESILVQVADKISASRPGARRDSIENYIQRLTELEEIANDLTGVERAFAISAGREIRVLVNPTELTELETYELAQTIATNIEGQLRYPGEIKVNVIRETTVISYAR